MFDFRVEYPTTVEGYFAYSLDTRYCLFRVACGRSIGPRATSGLLEYGFVRISSSGKLRMTKRGMYSLRSGFGGFIDQVNSGEVVDTGQVDGTNPTDAEVIEYQRSLGANFGSIAPVDVVRFGLLKAACCWHNGSTCDAILKHHGLIRDRKKGGKRLTRKGRDYLWNAFGRLVPRSSGGEGE